MRAAFRCRACCLWIGTGAGSRGDLAAECGFERMAELRKKVKISRATQLDGQCQRFKSYMAKGYVYAGGTFAEHEMLAHASGCVALAKASKAPWFCCR